MKHAIDRFMHNILLWGVGLILALLPFHAFLTVWFSSTIGHYTALRLWKEALLGIVCVAALYVVARQPRTLIVLQKRKELQVIIGFALLYLLVISIWGLVAYTQHSVTAKALGYGVLSDGRFMLFLLVCIVAGTMYASFWRKHWTEFLVYPGLVVIALGLLQFVLPHDVLRHVGYGPHTIAPYIAVDNKPDYVRVQSTLRGPNPLGAYLVLIGAALTAAVLAHRKRYMAALVIACIVVLFGTYSRSAWLGFIVAVIIIVSQMIPRQLRKVAAVLALGAAIIGIVTIIGLRHNDTAQNIFFHTDETSQSATSSNQNRANAINEGVSDIIHKPLGSGVGTAGPASVYNDNKARISENYFLQIGQEMGIIGLALFAAINACIALILWRARHQTLAAVLLASLAGLTLVNLLSHAWADDTLAYVWWGFAGIMIGIYASSSPKQKRI